MTNPNQELLDLYAWFKRKYHGKDHKRAFCESTGIGFHSIGAYQARPGSDGFRRCPPLILEIAKRRLGVL